MDIPHQRRLSAKIVNDSEEYPQIQGSLMGYNWNNYQPVARKSKNKDNNTSMAFYTSAKMAGTNKSHNSN